MLSAVLSVSVKRVKLIQEKVAGRHFLLFIFSYLSNSSGVLAGVRDTHKKVKSESSDRQMIMSGG